MDPNKQTETLNKVNNSTEEKESKGGNRRLYGQVLIVLIVITMAFEYYVYNYKVMWNSTNSK